MGKERVRQLMQRHGIKAKGKRKFVVTTDSKHHMPVAPDLVQRRFTPEAPNTVWTGDITYIATDEGWLYLVVALELHSRQIVGWSLQSHMQTSLCQGRAVDGLFPAQAPTGTDLSQRPRQPILQYRVPGHAHGLRYSHLHESQG